MISKISSTSSVASTSTATCRRVTQTLNFTYGSAGTIITDTIQYALKEEGVNDNLKKRYAEVKILRGEIFEGNKRVTAGLLFKASQLDLDSNVLNSQEQKSAFQGNTFELCGLTHGVILDFFQPR